MQEVDSLSTTKATAGNQALLVSLALLGGDFSVEVDVGCLSVFVVQGVLLRLSPRRTPFQKRGQGSEFYNNLHNLPRDKSGFSRGEIPFEIMEEIGY